VSRHLILDDGRSQRELVIRERMTVGRDPACDVSDADPRLSRRHAEFRLTPQGVTVKDLESRNGVRVNGKPVGEALLAPGDLVEIGHLTVRFVDDAPIDPAAQAFPTVVPRPVDQVQVKDGFEDDRTRVLAAPPMSTMVSGAISVAAVARGLAAVDPGDVAIREPGAIVPPRSPVRLGVQDLLATGWGWRVLAQGVLLAAIVFLMTVIPMLNWFNGVTGAMSTGLLVRMLSAPLLASIFAGLMVASLIARTTARALRRDDRSQA
jgi:pSer/pThr/pTyr-binding forkhead associated (FHA) protein